MALSEFIYVCLLFLLIKSNWWIVNEFYEWPTFLSIAQWTPSRALHYLGPCFIYKLAITWLLFERAPVITW